MEVKPKNFPGRKNDRRKAALSRMKPPIGTQSHADIALHPHTILSSRIVPDEIARDQDQERSYIARQNAGMTQRQPRLLDPGYLAWLRQQNCICGCNEPPPCDAAHLRAGSLKYNKPMTGMGRKPDDKWALPLKHSHHMRQHAFGSELEWWSAHGIGDPFRLCQWYYAAYGGTGGVERTRRAVKPRLPKERRVPIKSRGFQKGPKQKISSRGFK